MECGRDFGNTGALATHRRSKHGVTSAPRAPKKARKSRSLRFKFNAVELLRTSLLLTCLACSAYMPPPTDPPDVSRDVCGGCGNGGCRPRVKFAYQVADELGICPTQLSRWKKNAAEFAALAQDQPKMMKAHAGRPPAHPLLEDELYMLFEQRRNNTGLPVDCYWFRCEFGLLLERDHGHEHEFDFSNGWLANFCSRYNISSQLKTEKKFLSPEDRKSTLQDFHHDIHAMQCTFPQQCPVWGAYAPRHMWNADHVPLPFTINLKRSMNSKGTRCWIAHVGPCGLDKRQATIHPCIRADGEQFMPPFIIFRGGGHVLTEESDFLDSLDNIRWAFQDNAWADGHYSRRWLREFIAVLKDKTPGENHCLFLDDLKAQKTAKFRQIAYDADNLFVFPIPGGCTDLIQPVDHGVGAHMKYLMNKLYKIELEVDYELWRQYQESGALSAPRRRMLMASWLSTAWSFMQAHPEILHKSFTSTVLIRKDGSHELKIPIEGYDFPL